VAEQGEEDTVELRIDVPEHGQVTALMRRPSGAKWLLLLGHGAGAGMRHAFMRAVADRLAARAMATLRYQFPYMEAGRRRPDRPAVITSTIRAAAAVAADRADGLPLLAGGKSMGGRLTSVAQAEAPLPGVAGLVYFGFPLHAPGKPSSHRAEHLDRVQVPMLFLQGTRDRLADLGLLVPVVERLGGRATLHVIEGADHSFHMPKRSGRSDGEVLDELADTVVNWVAPTV
jgi:hypothetical protein